MIPNASRLIARVRRARSAAGRGIRYGLGKGGFDPNAVLPSGKDRLCDCSGFALAWAFYLNRTPKKGRAAWLETSAVYADATGPQKTFVRISAPVAGCAVVYPDRKVNGVHEEGHCAIVTDATFDSEKAVTLKGIDCSSGQSKRTGQAITERDLTFFLRRPDCAFVLLKEDFR